MFQWGRKSERPEPSGRLIEMKGSKTESEIPKTQWRGIWPSWEELMQDSGGSSSPRRPSAMPKPGRTMKGKAKNKPGPSMPRERCSSDAPECVSNSLQVAQSGCQPAEAVVSPVQDGNTESDDTDFYEVKMIIKVPKPTKMSSNESAQEVIIDELRAELERTQDECQKAVRALDSKSQECEDLVSLVRELTESRSQLTAFKAIQTERFEDLQQEYLRVLRIVELSRAISKENLAKTAQTMSKLNQVEEELARQRLITQQTKERLSRQKVDNLDLRERLNMLERMDLLAFRRESACMLKLQQLSLKETY